jgi:hypothetical protein
MRGIHYAIVLSSLAGCGDLCTEGATRCNGKQPEMCGHSEAQTSSDRHWYAIGNVCPGACLMVTNYGAMPPHTEAMCVDMATPASECNPANTANWDGTTCWNGMLTNCAQGNAYHASACPAGTHCLTGFRPEVRLYETDCVEAAAPIAECAPPSTSSGTQWDGTACWNGKVTNCAQGYPFRSVDCAAGTSCLSGVNPGSHTAQAQCVNSTSPVPECMAPDTSSGTKWDGSTCWNGGTAFCLDSHPYNSLPCPAGTHCATSRCPQEPVYSSACVLGSSPDGRCPSGQDGGGFCDGDTAVACWCGYVVQRTSCPPGDCTTGGSPHCLGQ